MTVNLGAAELDLEHRAGDVDLGRSTLAYGRHLEAGDHLDTYAYRIALEPIARFMESGSPKATLDDYTEAERHRDTLVIRRTDAFSGNGMTEKEVYLGKQYITKLQDLF